MTSTSYRLAAPYLGRLAALAALGTLAGCASLPSSGPTAKEIGRGVEPGRNPLGFQIVDVDAQILADVINRTTAADGAQSTLAKLALNSRNDVVGPGDVLSISIYEVGASLFAGGAKEQGGIYDPSAHSESFQAVVVDRNGDIRLPYIGPLSVSGHTTAEIQTMVERGLHGKSQSPQALVGVRQNIANTVYVAGDVRKPGRFDLTLQRERLLDAIALAGGAVYSSEDTIVRFNRGASTLEERLGRIRAGALDDLALVAGDRIELIKRPRSFIVLGATSKVSQIAFETGDLSLAEAIARSGGPTDYQADPSAIFLFRYMPPLPGHESDQPVVYRLDMEKPTSYFLSQRFAVRDKDVIYIANAGMNRTSKLVNIINAFFSPFVAARALSGN